MGETRLDHTVPRSRRARNLRTSAGGGLPAGEGVSHGLARGPVSRVVGAVRVPAPDPESAARPSRGSIPPLQAVRRSSGSWARFVPCAPLVRGNPSCRPGFLGPPVQMFAPNRIWMPSRWAMASAASRQVVTCRSAPRTGRPGTRRRGRLLDGWKMSGAVDDADRHGGEDRFHIRAHRVHPAFVIVPFGPQVFPSPGPVLCGSSITELPTIVPSATPWAIGGLDRVVVIGGHGSCHRCMSNRWIPPIDDM